MPDFIYKDPNAVIDIKFDWKALANGSGDTNWLADGETISTRTVTVPAGITKDSDALSDSSTSVVVWLSGGTEGQRYDVACKITTSAGRTDERTMDVRVVNR